MVKFKIFFSKKTFKPPRFQFKFFRVKIYWPCALTVYFLGDNYNRGLTIMPNDFFSRHCCMRLSVGIIFSKKTKFQIFYRIQTPPQTLNPNFQKNHLNFPSKISIKLRSAKPQNIHCETPIITQPAPHPY